VRVFDLADAKAAEDAMAGCGAALSFVGTMKNRFAAGDTYESSDVASTEQLVGAATRAKVPRFLLLSSYGAGGVGAYLQMKARCEQIVKEGTPKWTIFRPSALMSPEGGPEGTHGTRKVPAVAGALFGALRKLPGLGPVADDMRPIPIEVLCDAMLRVLEQPRDGATLQGRELWVLGTPVMGTPA
jgi:uncharacterized protein YbjT (DUF2867 family)